jgi:hypothetical protein
VSRTINPSETTNAWVYLATNFTQGEARRSLTAIDNLRLYEGDFKAVELSDCQTTDGSWTFEESKGFELKQEMSVGEFKQSIFENGDFGFYHTHLCEAHRDQAFYYAKKGEADKALEHLGLAAEHSIQFITSVNEEQTSLLLRGMDHGTWVSTDPDNDASRLLLKMDDAVFDVLRENEKFIQIKERLSEYAGKWCAE